MDLSQLPIFSSMTKRMSWLTQRQAVLAQNIANADTPDYKPRDLKPLDFKNIVRNYHAGLAATATHAGHLSPSGSARTTTTFQEIVQKDTHETTLSGNAVALEEQMMKAAETSMAYEMTVNLYRKHISMIKTALGRGN